MPANPLSGLLNRHRSIRRYKPDPVDAETAEAVCADGFRTRQWLRLRGARDNFDNLLGYHVAAFDAMIVPQNVCLGFEARAGHRLHGHDAALDGGNRAVPGAARPPPSCGRCSRRSASCPSTEDVRQERGDGVPLAARAARRHAGATRG